MSRIVTRLREVDDADARVIAHLDALDFTVDYIRQNLDSQYSDQDLDEAYQLVMQNQVSSDDFKDIIGEEFEAQALFFEDIVVFVYPSSRYEAIFASFDRHEALPITELVEVVSSSDDL